MKKLVVIKLVALTLIMGFYSKSYALSPVSTFKPNLYVDTSMKRSKVMDFEAYRKNIGKGSVRQKLTDRWNGVKTLKEYKLTPMVKELEGMPTRKFDKVVKALYMSEEMRKKFIVKIINGKLCNFRGIPINSSKDESIFFMSKDRVIYFFDKYLENFFSVYHSSFSCGESGVSMGTTRVVDGNISELMNETGHYEISFINFLQVIDELVFRGYKFKNLAVFSYKRQEIMFTLNTKDGVNYIKNVNFDNDLLERSA